MSLSKDTIQGWADDGSGPVALCLKQQLMPVEGIGSVIFPPTYVDIGYNIDELADGTRVATIDSVGSQANRLEPLFKQAATGRAANDLASLVPQTAIDVGATQGPVSLLEAGHRLGDAIVRSSTLREEAKQAFEHFLKTGDATAIAKLSPTSLVFGVWDSRDTSAKIPRVLQSVIRAWDVSKLTRSAQYGPPVDYSTLGVLDEDTKQAADNNAKSPLAQRGFVPVPAPGAHGGIVARGPIVRDVTINLVSLRRLAGEGQSDALRRYILGLAIVGGTAPFDGNLRQGCLLVPDPDQASEWVAVGRDGKRTALKLTHELALDYAREAAKTFGVGESKTARFEKDRAMEDIAGADKKKAAKKAAAKSSK